MSLWPFDYSWTLIYFTRKGHGMEISCPILIVYVCVPIVPQHVVVVTHHGRKLSGRTARQIRQDQIEYENR
jgi:hypothetical protein